MAARKHDSRLTSGVLLCLTTMLAMVLAVDRTVESTASQFRTTATRFSESLSLGDDFMPNSDRADHLERTELNQMHRHTLYAVVLCVGMLVAAVVFPSIRLAFGMSSLVMLLLVLPLRTVSVEMGIRYNRNGKPKNA